MLVMAMYVVGILDREGTRGVPNGEERANLERVLHCASRTMPNMYKTECDQAVSRTTRKRS